MVHKQVSIHGYSPDHLAVLTTGGHGPRTAAVTSVVLAFALIRKPFLLLDKTATSLSHRWRWLCTLDVLWVASKMSGGKGKPVSDTDVTSSAFSPDNYSYRRAGRSTIVMHETNSMSIGNLSLM